MTKKEINKLRKENREIEKYLAKHLDSTGLNYLAIYIDNQILLESESNQ